MAASHFDWLIILIRHATNIWMGVDIATWSLEGVACETNVKCRERMSLTVRIGSVSKKPVQNILHEMQTNTYQ